MIQAWAEAMDFSKSFASLRHRPSHANVRSTTQRRGRISNALLLSERLMYAGAQFAAHAAELPGTGITAGAHRRCFRQTRVGRRSAMPCFLA